MNRLCARNWRAPGQQSWTFCLLNRGHTPPCCGWNGPKRDDEVFFEDEVGAQAEIDAQRVAQAKEEAGKVRRKAAKKGLASNV